MFINNCRSCNSRELEMVLDLGEQPPSNSFIRIEQIKEQERSFPLAIVFCSSCYLVQLNYTVDPAMIFGDYVYVTSNTKPLATHLSNMAKFLYNYAKLKPTELVIDIGCNDGALLMGYPEGKVRLMGIEPSSVAKLAFEKGIPICNTFFNSKTANEVILNNGRAKVITATNVFAHVPDQDDFLKGINLVLHDDGMFVIEVPHVLGMLENNLFDTIYHEHFFYYSLLSLENLLDPRGLRIFHVEKYEFGPSGPPIRVFICKKDAKYNTSSKVKSIKDEETAYGLNRVDIYKQFANRIWVVKDNLLSMLEKLRTGGEKIVGFGAPAKGNTILNTFNINNRWLDCILEKNDLKCGLVTPGTHIPIVHEDTFEIGSYKYALLLSWNIIDFLLKKSQFIKNGGKFIVPLPEPNIFPIN